MSLPDIAGIKWKLISGGLGVALIGAAVFGAWVKIENIQLSVRVSSLTTEVRNLTKDLAQAHTNEANLTAAITAQNESILALQKDTAERLAAADTAIAAAQKARRTAEARVAVLLATPIKGDTLEQKIIDVDTHVLETLQ